MLSAVLAAYQRYDTFPNWRASDL